MISIFTRSLDGMAEPLLALSRPAKRILALLFDIATCVFTVWFAFYLRLGDFVPLTGNAFWAVVASIVISIPIFVVSGLYRAIFRYAGWPALVAVSQAIGVYALIYAAIFTVISIPGVPRTVGLIQPMLLLLFIGGSRIAIRFWLGGRYGVILKHAARPKVLVYGAGRTGRDLAASLRNSPEMQVVGFLDDDRRLHKGLINGLAVHDPADVEALVEKFNVAHVLLAMPQIGRKQRNEIIERLRESEISVRTLPSVLDLAQGKVTVSDLRELDIDDLLGRDPVMPDQRLLQENVLGKVVLVTGAGGSIGSELCRQILAIGPKLLVLVEQSEFALYTIHQDLLARFPDVQTAPILASVADVERMGHVMRTYEPQTVYHAAAYKHVPLVEFNRAEGIRNNVFGTVHMAQIALEFGVSDFVLISTDKAVRPTNVMGASKRLAEMTLQALAQDSRGTKFSIVRFGNVLGSSGSVVPKFRQQIRDGGPITLTHADIIRYFMTVPEAAQLVIQASAMSSGGDVFVLDMGEPVRIIDLAHRMVKLSGLTIKDSPDSEGDIEIQITGLRPGEKLYEELLIGDNPELTSHPRIMKAHEAFVPWPQLSVTLETLRHAIRNNDIEALESILHELVDGFEHSDDAPDLTDFVARPSERVEAAAIGIEGN